MAISLADLLASGPYVFGHPNRVETITPIPEIIFDANFIANAHRQLDSLAEDTSPSTNSIQMTPSTSGSHARRRYNNYHCVVCSRPYDRAERARDCANRDKGLTPHTFSGGTGLDKWVAPKPTALGHSYVCTLFHQRIVTSNAQNV